MRQGLINLLTAMYSLAAGAAIAQGPEGYDRIYDEPTNVNLGGRPVVADIELYIDPEKAAEGDLRLALVTDVTKFIAETESDLENWVATNQERCGERWDAGTPVIEFPSGAIRFALDLELEVWNCGWNGKGDPGRVADGAGRVDVTLEPYIQNGYLQTRLQEFNIDERRGMTRFLPLEFVTRRVINSELKKLNRNTKFYRPPQPLYDEDFRYESIRAQKYDDGRVVITARYKATGSENKLNNIIRKMRGDGITQGPNENKLVIDIE